MMKQKMIHKIYRILLLSITACILSGITSCHDERMLDAGGVIIHGDEITFTGTLLIPGMTEAITRGEPDEQAGSGLKLTVLEFDLGSNASSSFLTNVYYATLVDDTNVSDMTEVKFNLTIKASTTPKVLHFLLTDENEVIDVSSGSIASIFPSLVSWWGESYWGCREFPYGLTNPGATVNDSPTLKEGVIENLKKIPMIRNFAKISVEVKLDEGSEDGFELLGFDLVNVPTQGTVAPWDENNLSVPNLLKMDEYGKTVNEMQSYKLLTYEGYTPGSIMIENTETEARMWSEMDNTESRYVYEHPYDPNQRTYLIVCGKFIKNKTDEGEVSYYKIDLGYVDKNNVFKYCNIIRNYHYNVKITKVTGSGMPTVSEAIDRAPYNNISASTETSEMLQISDNKNLLVVDNNRFIITKDDQTIEVIYRYFKNIDKTEEEGGKELAPQEIKDEFIDLVPGSVVKSFKNETIRNDEGEPQYGKITIECNNPTDRPQRQSFTIVDGNGLGRTINLLLRKPWQYAYLRDGNGKLTNLKAAVAPGISNTYPFGSDGNYPNVQAISRKADKPLTVYFDLPSDLEDSMFPLEFRLEALNQGIENNKLGTLVVSSGPSLFDPNEITISYIKRVSLEEYKYMYDEDNNLDDGIPNYNHTIRCRFLTINEVASGSEGEIRIHNEYFDNDISVKFKRVDLPEDSDTQNPES